MKRLKLVLSLFVAFIAFNTQAQVNEKVDPSAAPVMTFEKTMFDFGTIKEGEKVQFDYKFTNTGKTDLLISRIKGSCGCTVPSNWKKEPIKPGETSSFHVVFNSRNKPNNQHKSVSITCNTAKKREVVGFKGKVIPDPEMAKMRAERAAKRKEMYAKRKAEREKLAKEKDTKQVNLNKKKLISSNSVKVNEKVDPSAAPVMTFEKTMFDFGTIKEGEKVQFDYKFTNTGKTDLLISRIKGSCGCTVPSNWKKEPIKPGETSSFHVVFNSRNKPNNQHKSVSITCNTAKKREVVGFKGKVIPDPEMAKMRAERAAKRKEMYAKRKAEREKLAKEKSAKGNIIEARNTAVLRAKENRLKKQEKSLEKRRVKSNRAVLSQSKKSEKEIKRVEKSEKEKLALAKKDQKLKERKFKAKEKNLKAQERIAEKKLKTEKEASKRAAKEMKLAKKEADRRLKKEKDAAKRAEKERKATEKAAKKAAKERKKLEKEVKRKAKLQKKVDSAIDRVAKETRKLEKMQSKFKRLEMKGKLSPNDVLDKKEAMLKQQEKINDAQAKLDKAKRKL